MKESIFPEEYDNNEQDPVLIPSQEVPDEDFLTELLDPDDGAYIKGPDEAVTEAVLEETDISEEAPVHEELTDPNTREELTAADLAMYNAGLHHPEDAEFHFEEEVLPAEEPVNAEEAAVEEVPQTEAAPAVPEAAPKQVTRRI